MDTYKEEISRYKSLVEGLVLDFRSKFGNAREFEASFFMKAKPFEEMDFVEGIRVFRLPSSLTYMTRVFYNEKSKVPPHYHRFHEIITIESGLMIDSSSGKEIYPGETYLIKPYTVHEIEVPIKTVAYVELLFDPMTGDSVQIEW